MKVYVRRDVLIKLNRKGKVFFNYIYFFIVPNFIYFYLFFHYI